MMTQEDKEFIEKLHNLAMDNAEMASLSKRKGDLEKFSAYSDEAMKYEKKAAMKLLEEQIEPTRSVLFRSAGYLALDNANYIEAQKLYEYALDGDPPKEIRDELKELKVEIDRIRIENENFIQVAITFLKNETPPISGEKLDEIINRSLGSFQKDDIYHD